jgi:hypothetical protein
LSKKIKVFGDFTFEKRGEPVQLQVDNLSSKHGGIPISGFGRRFLVDKTGQDQVKSLA